MWLEEELTPQEGVTLAEEVVIHGRGGVTKASGQLILKEWFRNGLVRPNGAPLTNC